MSAESYIVQLGGVPASTPLNRNSWVQKLAERTSATSLGRREDEPRTCFFAYDSEQAATLAISYLNGHRCNFKDNTVITLVAAYGGAQTSWFTRDERLDQSKKPENRVVLRAQSGDLSAQAAPSRSHDNALSGSATTSATPSSGVSGFSPTNPLLGSIYQAILQIDPNDFRSLDLACSGLPQPDLVPGQHRAYSADIVVRDYHEEIPRDMRGPDEAYILCVPRSCVPLPPRSSAEFLIEVLASVLEINTHTILEVMVCPSRDPLAGFTQRFPKSFVSLYLRFQPEILSVLLRTPNFFNAVKRGLMIKRLQAEGRLP